VSKAIAQERKKIGRRGSKLSHDLGNQLEKVIKLGGRTEPCNAWKTKK